MKHLQLTTTAAAIMMGCVTDQSKNLPKLHNKGVDTQEPVSLDKTTSVEQPSISIHKAVSIGDIEAVRQHLAIGTDPNLKFPVVNPPLFFAGPDIDMLTLLVQNGADVNDIGHGMTALHKYSNPESVRFLVGKVEDVNAIDDFGDTPLHGAVEGYIRNRKKSVEILIAAGAEVNAINFNGLTPLDYLLSKNKFMKSEKLKLDISNLMRKHGAKTSEELRLLHNEKLEDDDSRENSEEILPKTREIKS